jgi:hypothetical protein
LIRIKRIIVFCFLIHQGISLPAQVQDACLWMTANLEKKLTRSFSAVFKEEVRLNENITEVGTVFSDIGLEYSLSKRFRIAGHYRFILKRSPDDSYEPRMGYYFDFTYREKVSLIRLNFRLRFQSRFSDLQDDVFSEIPEYYLRFRIRAEADLNKRYEPYLSAEPFIQMNSPEGFLFEGMRYCAGVEYSFSRMHKVDVYYQIQQEYQVRNPLTEFITGISYTFTF